MRARRLIGFVLAGLSLLLLGSFDYLRSSLPKLHGELELAGLGAELNILRDANAVPHIHAVSPEDAYFALGFVHAQDRLWQMEFQRRVGAGRLSEVLGEATLGTDRFLRTLGVYRAAEASIPNLEPETLSALNAYVAGINGYLETRRGALPPEFLFFRFAPEPWQVADVLVWAKMMAWDLSGNWDDELLRARLSHVLEPGQIAELWPPYPGDAPVTPPDFSVLYEDLPLDALWAESPKPEPPSSGSNIWVVNGSSTETGSPLLANDPHLRMQAPSLWYFAHLNAPGLKVAGATLPGLPVVLLGHNEDVAWGFTNTGPDVQDLFIEELNPDNENEYRTPNGFAPFETREEIIRVKGQEDVVLTVRETRHGPVISDASADVEEVAGEKRVLAFAWPMLDEQDATVQAILGLNRAANWQDFRNTLQDFWGAQQNIFYADTAGNIGYTAPGRIPIRRSGNGSVPVPGWTGEYDWAGYIPFEDLPQSYNPASGELVNANNKVAPDDYPYFLTADWAEPYRAERIADLLSAAKPYSLERFASLQQDDFSLMAEAFTPYLANLRGATQAETAALEVLTDFGGEMAREGAAPLVFAAWYRELGRALYADETGELFGDTHGFRPLFTLNALATESDWCNDVTTPDPETCAEVAQVAFEAAVRYLSETFGAPENWAWGEAHYAHHAHRVFTGTPLARFFDLTIPAAGDAFTVNAARFPVASAEEPFRLTHGPGFRAVYDLANLDNSRFIHTTGQSGNPLSKHYGSFLKFWRDGEYIRIPVSREAAQGAIGALRLLPE